MPDTDKKPNLEGSTEKLESSPRIQVTEPQLLVIEGDQVGQVVPITSGKFALGGSAQCQFCIPERGVSQRHAEVEHTNGQVSIRDLSSTNGTFVNGTQIKEAILRE